MLGFINQLTKPPPNRLPSSSLPSLHLLDLLGDHTPVALVIVAVADAEPLHLLDQPLQLPLLEHVVVPLENLLLLVITTTTTAQLPRHQHVLSEGTGSSLCMGLDYYSLDYGNQSDALHNQFIYSRWSLHLMEVHFFEYSKVRKWHISIALRHCILCIYVQSLQLL